MDSDIFHALLKSHFITFTQLIIYLSANKHYFIGSTGFPVKSCLSYHEKTGLQF